MFQSYSFQSYSFQTEIIEDQSYSGGYTDRPYKGSYREHIESVKRSVDKLPHKIKKAIKKISKEELKREEREAALLAEISHIDSGFQLVYLGYLEQLHSDWVDREIARLLHEKQVALQMRQNEEALILLLLL